MTKIQFSRHKSDKSKNDSSSYSLVEFSEVKLHGDFLMRRIISWELTFWYHHNCLKILKEILYAYTYHVQYVIPIASKMKIAIPQLDIYRDDYNALFVKLYSFSELQKKCAIPLRLWISDYVNLFMLIYNRLLGFSVAVFKLIC